MPSHRPFQSRSQAHFIPFPFDEQDPLVGSAGAFETCRVRQGQVLHLEEHLRRLVESLKTLGIFSWQPERARNALVKAAKNLRDGYVRINVRQGAAERFILHRIPRARYARQELLRGLSIRVVPTRWPLGESYSAQVKGSERLVGILGRIEGGACSEVLRIGPHGYWTEGTVSNLFLVKGGRLLTPPTWLGVLEGVTRAAVFKAARRIRIEVQEVPLTRHDLFNAEEAFLTNVLMGIFPVREVDGRRIGGGRLPGPVTRRLMKALTRS